MYDNEVFTHNGNRFRLRIMPDDCQIEPWKEYDGHGPVSDWTRRDKAPGERVLCSDRGFKRYYDFQAAIAIAKRDGWDAAPYATGTKGETAARAVEADFKRLRDFCNGYWDYVGLVVCMVDDDDDDIDGTEASLWGIESDCSEFIEETARELADESAAIAFPKVA